MSNGIEKGNDKQVGKDDVMYMRQIKKENSGSPGYILTEGIIASAIILTAVIGILALLASSLRMAQFARAQLTASMLAQEGIEVVRAIRDANWIAAGARPWNFGLSNGDYLAQYNSIALTPLGGPPPPLRFDPATRFFQYDSGDNTEFIRRIIVSNLSPAEMRVISNVSWTVRGIRFSIDVEDHLFNWFQ